MARPKKTDVLDLTERVNLTAGAIERLTCPADKQQAFLRDSGAPGLRVRVTPAGHKSFVYEAKLNRQTIRRTIGDVKLWSIEQARTEARRLAVVLDKGQDPREIERQRQQEREAERQRHGGDHGRNRALHVDRAAPIEQFAAHFRFECAADPAFAGRDDVEVPGKSQVL